MSAKKLIYGLVALMAAGLGVFFYVVPRYVDRTHNAVHAEEPGQTSIPSQGLHARLRISDLHADSLLWDRDLLQENSWGHVDIPRLIKGNIALQAFSVVTKTPRGLNIERNSAATDNIRLLSIAQRWPPRTWTSLKERAVYQSQKLHDFAARSNGAFVIVKSRADLQAYLAKRRTNARVTAGWLTVEGAHALEGELANVNELYNAGFRMIAPSHLADSEIGGSASGENKGGLTKLGEDWVRAMDSKKMIIDLAHASAKTIDDVLNMTTQPVLVSHTGVKGTCDNNRNLNDEQLRRIAHGGGLIGIGFWEYATCGKDVLSIVRAIRYTSDLVGVDHVALGSDWDGYVATPIDAAHIGALTEALQQAGLNDADIGKIMGENTIAFLGRNLP
ncbi:MAG: membrane dipeptidase [Burkholderiales bacterium]